MRENKKGNIISESMKKAVLSSLLNRPKTITELSRDLKKDPSNMAHYIKEMKEYIEEEEFIKNKRGKCKLIKLKKKAYHFLNHSLPSENEKVDNTKSLKRNNKTGDKYLSMEELAILNYGEDNGQDI
jgi:hypothetical protein